MERNYDVHSLFLENGIFISYFPAGPVAWQGTKLDLTDLSDPVLSEGPAAGCKGDFNDLEE